jgi:hypothetical protein
VIRTRESLGDICLITTDEVLAELLDGLAPRGTHLREAAARAGSEDPERPSSDGSSAVA